MEAPNPMFSKGFNTGLQGLFNANEGDVVFVCGPLNQNVHSLLLGARSKVLKTMVEVPFQEGLNKRIELKQQDPYLAVRMLGHIYGFDYSGQKISIGDEEEPSHVSELHTHASMYALGDEYDILDLKEEALWKFKKSMKAIKGHSDELTFVVEVIPTVYRTTPSSDRDLRDAVVAFGAKNLERIKDLSGFKSAVTQVPTYIVEVLSVFLQRLEDEKVRHSGMCQYCSQGGRRSFDRILCHRCGHHTILDDKNRVNVSQ